MDIDDYADIMQLPHYEPKRHPRMAADARAAQFAPFAALAGYDDAVKETARETDPRTERGADSLNALDRKLEWLRKHLQEKPLIGVRYFLPDDKKDGGSYLNYSGRVKKIDESMAQMVFCDGTRISLQAIFAIDSDGMDSLDEY